MIHTNALIVWLLLGFFGGTYYLLPEEAERELFSVKLAYLQLAILVVGTLGAVVSYLFGIHGGREFLEQPLWVKVGILVAALIFLVNVSLTALAGRKTAITNILLLGLWLLVAALDLRLHQPGQPRRSTRCTGGSSSTSGSRRPGSWSWPRSSAS